MLAVVPPFVEDAGAWAAAFAAVTGAGMLIVRAAKSGIVGTVAPQLHELREALSGVHHKIDQLSADNTAQHVANANAALLRDRELTGQIGRLTDELRDAGDRFDRRIVAIEDTVADHIANRFAHQPGGRP